MFSRGATHSRLCIYSGDGKELASIPGPMTNHWSLGATECAKRIANMVNEGKKVANIEDSTPLDVLVNDCVLFLYYFLASHEFH